MQLDKHFVIDEIKKQGDSPRVQAALDELPAKVDHEKDAALLQKFGVDPGLLAASAAKAGLEAL